MDETTVYLDGKYLPRSEAGYDLEDRGMLFADGVYEVTRYVAGRGYLFDRHLARLKRSCEAIRLPMPEAAEELDEIGCALIQRNGWGDANIYWQVTRGTGKRSRPFPEVTRPVLLVMGWPAQPIEREVEPAKVILRPDRRWMRGQVKSLMLLDGVLEAQRAAEAGAAEAIMHRDGWLTEGTATNLFALYEGVVLTPAANRLILGGVTRDRVIELARAMNLVVVQAPLHVSQLASAEAVFLTGTTTLVRPISSVSHVEDTGCGEIIREGNTPEANRLVSQLRQSLLEDMGVI